MGKDNENQLGVATDAVDEVIDPDDPMYWDEAKLREYVNERLDKENGRYRSKPSTQYMVLDDNQKITVADAVVKYWMPEDIDAVYLLAEEEDRARFEEEKAREQTISLPEKTASDQETPHDPEDRPTFEGLVRSTYDRKQREGLTGRQALNHAKDLVANRLSARDLKGLPSIAQVHVRQIIHWLASWEQPNPIPEPTARKETPYSNYL